MMLGSAVVDGIIYAIGGGFDAYLTDVVEAYDPATDRWTNKASKPTQSSCFGTAVVEKKIYLVGGAQKTSAYPTEMYDPATDKWSTLKPITIPVAGLACAAANGKIYAIGGVDANYACRDLLQVYDVATNTWATKAHMPLARFGSVATVIANKIYVFGGAVFPMNVATKTLQVYEIETNTWTSEELLPEATQWAAIATNPDNSVYILAGENKCMMTYSDATIYKFLYKFKVNSTGIETLNANNDCSLSIIPNPATQQVTIKYRTVEDGIVTIEMYNITGNKIDVLTNRFEQQGLHEITQNMVNLPAGIYFCRLKSGTAMRMEKVVKIN
jgi:N-acetylneuraminic acid mutarotase